MGTAIKHPVPDRVKPSFVIFNIRALWRSYGNSGRQRVAFWRRRSCNQPSCHHEMITIVLTITSCILAYRKSLSTPRLAHAHALAVMMRTTIWRRSLS